MQHVHYCGLLWKKTGHWSVRCKSDYLARHIGSLQIVCPYYRNQNCTFCLNGIFQTALSSFGPEDQLKMVLLLNWIRLCQASITSIVFLGREILSWAFCRAKYGKDRVWAAFESYSGKCAMDEEAWWRHYSMAENKAVCDCAFIILDMTGINCFCFRYEVLQKHYAVKVG